MIAHMVADVGNTRIKWGVCARTDSGPVVIRRASLPDDNGAWTDQLDQWLRELNFLGMMRPLTWVAAGVHPERVERLVQWLTARGERVVVLDKPAQVPLTVDVDEPERVGLDRLLNAVAAKRDLQPSQAAILVDVGSAVTVDYLDESHVFRGGAIFPGVSLMTKALHDYTALLPEVTIRPPAPALPGRSTTAAIQAGVYWAVLGGIERIARRLQEGATAPPAVFMTGGDAEWLVETLDNDDKQPWLESFSKTLWPEQTLQGILYCAEAMSE